MTKSSGCIPGFEHHPHRDSASVASGIPPLPRHPSPFCRGIMRFLRHPSTAGRRIRTFSAFSSLSFYHWSKDAGFFNIFLIILPPPAEGCGPIFVIPHRSAEGCCLNLVIPHFSAEGYCTRGGLTRDSLENKKVGFVREGLTGG